MRQGLLLLLFAWLLSGCSGLKVTTDYDPEASFEALRTFSVLLPDNKTADPLNDERIIEALEQNLETKGYSVTDKTTADFHVLFRTSRKQNVPSNVSFGFGFGTFSGGSGASIATSTRGSYDRRVLNVDIIDPETDKAFWRGGASDTLRPLETPAERKAYINEMVDTLLKTFPDRRHPGEG